MTTSYATDGEDCMMESWSRETGNGKIFAPNISWDWSIAGLFWKWKIWSWKTTFLYTETIL